MTTGYEMEPRVLTRLRKDFLVDSEDWNDVAFTRQRIRWTRERSQMEAVDELEEIPVERRKTSIALPRWDR